MLKNLLTNEKANPPVGLLMLIRDLRESASFKLLISHILIVQTIEQLVKLLLVLVVHTFSEVFNFEIQLLLETVVFEQHIDSSFLSIVNGILYKRRAALPQSHFITDNHLGYVIVFVLSEVVQ